MMKAFSWFASGRCQLNTTSSSTVGYKTRSSNVNLCKPSECIRPGIFPRTTRHAGQRLSKRCAAQWSWEGTRSAPAVTCSSSSAEDFSTDDDGHADELPLRRRQLLGVAGLWIGTTAGGALAEELPEDAEDFGDEGLEAEEGEEEEEDEFCDSEADCECDPELDGQCESPEAEFPEVLEADWRPNAANGNCKPCSSSKGSGWEEGELKPREVSQQQPGSSAMGGEGDLPSSSASLSEPLPDFTREGPFQTGRLPRLEHTCAGCFPDCVGLQCLLRVDVVYPKGPGLPGRGPPYPLGIFSAGFLVPGLDYLGYAQRLASWGWTVLLYDRLETPLDSLPDTLAVRFIREIIDWSSKDPLLSRLADTRRVYLCGHSRGAKLSVLAAAADPRVAGLCLLDPVDNTVWAPLGPSYPSAVQALLDFGSQGSQGPFGSRQLPMAVVGSGVGGDCAPPSANYSRFFGAAPGPAWQVVVPEVGHFQFVDSPSSLQKAVCAAGSTPDEVARQISQAVMVAWGEIAVRGLAGKQPALPEAKSAQLAAAVRQVEQWVTSQKYRIDSRVKQLQTPALMF